MNKWQTGWGRLSFTVLASFGFPFTDIGRKKSITLVIDLPSIHWFFILKKKKHIAGEGRGLSRQCIGPPIFKRRVNRSWMETAAAACVKICLRAEHMHGSHHEGHNHSPFRIHMCWRRCLCTRQPCTWSVSLASLHSSVCHNTHKGRPVNTVMFFSCKSVVVNFPLQ